MVPDETTPNECSSCGARLDPDAAFCSQCGSAVDRIAAATDRDRGRRAFRERVREYRVHGWEIEQDYGDRVVVRKRGFGSLPVHALLLLATGGVGNVLYAWYRYGPGAARAELRSDGRERWVDDRAGGGRLWDAVGTAAGVLLGVFFAFLLFALLTQDAVVAAGAATLVLAGILSVLWFSESEGGRSLATFGRERSVDESVAADGSDACVVCGRNRPGVVHSYAERFYVAGVPVWTVDEGRNRYCRECTGGAGADNSAPEAIRETDR